MSELTVIRKSKAFQVRGNNINTKEAPKWVADAIRRGSKTREDSNSCFENEIYIKGDEILLGCNSEENDECYVVNDGDFLIKENGVIVLGEQHNFNDNWQIVSISD